MGGHHPISGRKYYQHGRGYSNSVELRDRHGFRVSHLHSDPDRYCDKHRHRDADLHPHSNGNGNLDADWNADWNRYTDQHGYPGRYDNSNGLRYSNGDDESDVDTDPNQHVDPKRHRFADDHDYKYLVRESNRNEYADANQYGHDDHDTNGNGNAGRDRDPDTNRNRELNVHTDVDVDPDGPRKCELHRYQCDLLQ